jgi:hypothetical protein
MRLSSTEIETRAIRGYRADDLAEKPLVDIVRRIDQGLRSDAKILDSWERFFVSKRVPHFVMGQGRGFLAIMKEDVVGNYRKQAFTGVTNRAKRTARDREARTAQDRYLATLDENDNP